MTASKTLRLDGSTFWFAGEARELTDEDQTTLRDLSRRTAAWNRARGNAWLAEIGRELHDWLGNWAAGLSAPDLTLDVIATDSLVREAPWELLHDGTRFLVDNGFEVVRRLESRAQLPAPLPEHGLTLVFMAASPTTSRPGLSRLRYEEEEAAILRALATRRPLSAEELGTRSQRGELLPNDLLLSVEETGTPSGLGERLGDLAQEAPAPVVHITAHGAGSPPALLLEDDGGEETMTSASELREGVGFRLALASLVVVSACETAASGVDSFAISLVKGGVQAALGWSASVSDKQATVFASCFYARIREGDPLDRALNAARRHLKGQRPPANTDWHLARLVARPLAGGPIVRKGGLIPTLGRGSRAFGGNDRVEIARRLQFVGRRPNIQKALKVLKAGQHAGVLVTGLGHQGKSSLAGRIADRRRGSIAVCWGAKELRAPRILLTIQEALGVAGEPAAIAARKQVAEHSSGLQRLLVRLLESEPNPHLLVLDDVEQVLDQTKTPVQVLPDYEEALRAVLMAFAQLTSNGRQHRLVLTSRVTFLLRGWGGEDLVAAHLSEVHLVGMGPVERELLPTSRSASMLPTEARVRCLDASAGNPGLVALLLGLAQDLFASGELERLPELLAGHPGASPDQEQMDAWMEEVVGHLVSRLTNAQRDLLRTSGVLPGPVPRSAVLAALSPVTGATERDAARLEALGLWELHSDESTGRRAISPAPLALRCVEPIEGDRCGEVAGSILTALDQVWAPPPLDQRGARTFVVLSLLAGRGQGLAGPGEVVLASLIAAQEFIAARGLGRRIIACMQADDLPLPDGLRLRVADAVEGESTKEALALLNGVEEQSRILLRRGQLLQRGGNLDAAERDFLAFAELNKDDPHGRAVGIGCVADILEIRGDLDEALRIRQEEEIPVYERLGDVRQRALAMGRIADILYRRGGPDEALRIRKEEEIPIYERLGDVYSRAVSMGRIADILSARGELDEALRIREEEEIPVYERLGTIRERAVAMGKIADILYQRGELNEALRIRKEEEIPVYERLGDVRSRALTMAKIADILSRRGELDEAIRIFRDEVKPILEQLGDVRFRALTMAKIADILSARGELDEALHILRDEVMPSLERLGDVHSRAAALAKIAYILSARGEPDEALRILCDDVKPSLEKLGDVRSWAVLMGRVAEILSRRGEFGDALRILRDEVRPIFEQLGDVRELAVTMGQVADILSTCGKLDEALRIRKEEEIPVYERLGDARSLMVTRVSQALTLHLRGRREDAEEIRQYFVDSVAVARNHGFPERQQIEAHMRRLGLVVP